MAQKGGIKLRRGTNHKNMYVAQFHRTARNKMNRAARLARRKREMPQAQPEPVQPTEPVVI